MAVSSVPGLRRSLRTRGWSLAEMLSRTSRKMELERLEHTLLHPRYELVMAMSGPVLGEPNPWRASPERVGKYPGWEQAVHFFNFMFAVERMAKAISVVTMCRELLERQPDLFTFCMNEKSYAILLEEMTETWGLAITREDVIKASRGSNGYIFGKPITIVALLPDGIVIGGE